MPGYIKLFRDIQDHWIWQDPVRYWRWSSILFSVNHCDKKVLIGNQLIVCERGQSVKSLETWAKQWNTTKKTVKNFFLMLEKDSMLKYEPMQITTRITVCNYDKYQGSGYGRETGMKRKIPDEGTQATPKQKIIKNENNDKETRIAFENFWDAYDKKVGKKDCEKLWHKLSFETKQKILETLPAFKKTITNKKFQPYPETYLRKERWNDEIPIQHKLQRIYNPETGRYSEMSSKQINIVNPEAGAGEIGYGD